jgi:hypothetical protein
MVKEIFKVTVCVQWLFHFFNPLLLEYSYPGTIKFMPFRYLDWPITSLTDEVLKTHFFISLFIKLINQFSENVQTFVTLKRNFFNF